MKTIICECCDLGCREHEKINQCTNPAKIEIERIDMIDSGSMVFCNICADDVFESGLFRELGELYQ